MALLELKDIVKVYDGGQKVAALNGVSLSVEAGELAAVAGPSGSGKSTLLNIAGTLDAPTRGHVLFEGRELTKLGGAALADFRLSNLGFIFQAYNLIGVLSALENVEYVLLLQGVEAGERRERAREALKRVGLAREADRRPDHLSGGQQQRVAVARAVVGRPRLILADEPTANLDSKTAESLLDLMVELNEESGATFLFSSHDERVLSRAHRVVRMRDGQVV
ncbi:MAG: ABC transporter ATP-binding protein [Elusimicrobiota bacterium]